MSGNSRRLDTWRLQRSQEPLEKGEKPSPLSHPAGDGVADVDLDGHARRLAVDPLLRVGLLERDPIERPPVAVLDL